MALTASQLSTGRSCAAHSVHIHSFTVNQKTTQNSEQTIKKANKFNYYIEKS